MLIASWPAAASGKHCSNSSLRGTYTYAFEANLPAGGPVAAVVGTITFDGNGKLTGTLTQNTGKGQEGPFSFDGTYTVNRDCTYTSEFGNPKNPSHQFGIIAQNGDKIRVLNTDPGLILEFTAEKEEQPSEH
jgi:hypothetical protein